MKALADTTQDKGSLRAKKICTLRCNGNKTKRKICTKIPLKSVENI